MQERIFGLETEYGITYVGPGEDHLSPEETARLLFKPVVDQWRSSNVFLPNGGRLYLDVGSHPEYATAETTSPRQALIQDKAGEALYHDLVNQAQDQLEAEGRQGRIYLFKNNTDSAGNSFGSHENYMLERKVEFSRLSNSLLPFLVTRQILVGSGRIHPAGPPPWPSYQAPTGRPSFSFSQRADHLWEGASTSTTRARPLINTRDEPHADASRYRRLHLINGDSNMSEATSLLKMGATDLVLRMLEDFYPLADLALKDIPRALRQVSHDLTGGSQLQLADGSQSSALTMQFYYHQMASYYVEEKGAHHPDVPYILELWGRTLQAIESGDHSLIDREIDWAIKKKLLDTYCQRWSVDYSDPRIQQLDLAYHDIDPQRGVYGILARKGQVLTLLDPQEIDRATVNPPATRARVRSRFIQAARAAGEPYTVDWVHLKLNNRPHQVLTCPDPFASENSQLEALLADLPASKASGWATPLV